MDAMDFARRFGQLYREVYLRAVRRVDDGRERLSPETTALLLHLSQAGPSTLTELARHLHRSASTLSAKVSALEDGQRRQLVEALQRLVQAIPAPTHPDGEPHR